MIITLQTTLTLSGLEAPLNCQRRRTVVRLSSPRTFEATSIRHSVVGAGCSSSPPKSGLRNSRLQTTEHSSLEKRLSVSLTHSHTVRMSQALDESYTPCYRSQKKKSSSRVTFN